MSGSPWVLTSLSGVALAAALGACSSDTAAPSAASSAQSSAQPSATTVTVTATGSPSPSASLSRTASPSPSASPPASGRATTTAGGNGGTAEFVRVVRAKVPDVAAGRTTAEIAGIATTACRSLRGGRSAGQIAAEARSLGTLDAEATDDATARELVKLAIDTTCLDQARRVDEF